MKKTTTFKWLDKLLKNKTFLIMKLTLILVLLNVLTLSAKTYSQETLFTIDMKDASIQQVLNEISNQSEFTFAWSSKFVDLSKKVTIRVKDSPVEKVLNHLFKASDVKYIIVGKQIILSPSGKAAIQSQPEKIIIQGTVKSATNGSTLPGVSILLKGTTRGTVTDLNGHYSISAPKTGTLVFSYVGFKSQEIPIANQKIININLISTSIGLKELVVIGYGSVQKRDVTSAISTVSTEDIAFRPLTNVGDAIQGMASGVQVISPSGAPGGGVSVRIRGSTSVLAGNDPLYVIDGIPTMDMSSISPQDIQSIQILKSAAAAAIYGARASNGVIIITTKKGKAGHINVSYNGYGGLSFSGNMKVVPLNTPQYRSLMNEILGEGAVPSNITTNTNWMKETFKTGVTQNHQVQISTGNKYIKTFLSLGYFSDKGVIHPSVYTRYNFMMNNNMQLFKWLKVASIISYANSLTNGIIQDIGSDRGGVILSAINTPPIIGIWDKEHPLQYAINPYQSSWESPLADLSRKNTTRKNKLLIDINAKVNFLNDFKYKINFGLDYNGYQNDQFTDPIRTSYGRSQNGVGSTDRSTTTVWLIENTLSYNKTIKKSTFTVLLGQSIQSSHWNNAYISGKDFPKTLNISTLNAANQITDAGTQISEWATSSFFGRLIYNYNNKYLINVSMRFDGSSKLALNNKWGGFSAVSAAWRISEEPFLKAIKSVVNDLKIRVGIGKNGNQNGLPDYAWQALYSFGRVTPTNPLSGPSIYQSTIENTSLKWETTTQMDAGIDASFLNSLVSISIDAYLKNTDGLLMNVPLPQGAAPVNYITRNDGKMQNWGMEFSLNAVKHHKNWSWNAGINISFNRNKIKNLGLAKVYYYARTPNNQYAIRVAPGYSLGTFYGYIAKGVDPETGNMIYADLNKNGIIDPGDRTVIGHAQPNFIFGMNGSISYKGIGLSFLIQGTKGNQIFNASRIVTEGMYDSKNQSTAVLRRWERPGQVTSVPSAVSNGSTYNVYNSSRFVEDGSYLRIKSITLYYSFPKKWFRNRLQGFRVYATGNNLLTLTRYSGFDPEINYMGNNSVVQGVDYGTYPHYQTIIFGFNVQF